MPRELVGLPIVRELIFPVRDASVALVNVFPVLPTVIKPSVLGPRLKVPVVTLNVEKSKLLAKIVRLPPPLVMVPFVVTVFADNEIDRPGPLIEPALRLRSTSMNKLVL